MDILTGTVEVMTVIVIEDDPDLRRFICRLLELDGFKVLQAKDAKSGLELARQSKISLVILDLRLPGQDGWDFLRQLRGEPALSVIPVIVFTASAGVSQKERAIRMGVIDYIVKPMGVRQLQACIAGAVKDRR